MTDGTGSGGVIGRRGALLTLGSVAALPLLSGCGFGHEALPDPRRPDSRLDSLLPSVDSYLSITNGNTGEHVALRFMDSRGNYDRAAMRKLRWMFRDWRENRAPEVDPRLFWTLAALSDAARKSGRSGEVRLLSGYRTRRTNNMLRQQGKGAASNSYHVRRRAMDIRLEGVEMEEVADYAEWLGVGGVGRYPSANFTHVDSGPIRTWTY